MLYFTYAIPKRQLYAMGILKGSIAVLPLSRQAQIYFAPAINTEHIALFINEQRYMANKLANAF